MQRRIAQSHFACDVYLVAHPVSKQLVCTSESLLIQMGNCCRSSHPLCANDNASGANTYERIRPTFFTTKSPKVHKAFLRGSSASSPAEVLRCQLTDPG